MLIPAGTVLYLISESVCDHQQQTQMGALGTVFYTTKLLALLKAHYEFGDRWQLGVFMVEEPFEVTMVNGLVLHEADVDFNEATLRMPPVPIFTDVVEGAGLPDFRPPQRPGCMTIRINVWDDLGKISLTRQVFSVNDDALMHYLWNNYCTLAAAPETFDAKFERDQAGLDQYTPPILTRISCPGVSRSDVFTPPVKTDLAPSASLAAGMR